MTVSRVFRDSTRVSDDTRLRVLEAAREVGYQPNVAARALRTGEVDTLGFLVASHDSFRGPFHSECFAGFESVVSLRGLGVTVSIPSSAETLPQRARRLVAEGRCGALVIRFDRLEEGYIEALSTVGAPVVLVNYNPRARLEDYGVSAVGFDNHHAVQLAVRHVVSLGHRRIAYLGGTPGWIDADQREEGFRAAMEELELPVEEKWIQACDFGEGFATGHHGLGQILGRALPGPTAVVCASDEIATGAMASARQWGRSIPEDFSVVGFDDDQWSSFLSPPLTTVRHSGWFLGKQAGEILLERLDRPDTPPKRIVLETELVVRESTGPAPH
jgi:LacI family transcriptional regulator